MGYNPNPSSRNIVSSNRKHVTAKMDNTKRRRLSQAEMEDRRSRGLCFFCDEKFVPGHKCMAKRQQFSLDIEVSEGNFIEEEDQT